MPLNLCMASVVVVALNDNFLSIPYDYIRTKNISEVIFLINL